MDEMLRTLVQNFGDFRQDIVQQIQNEVSQIRQEIRKWGKRSLDGFT